MNSAATTTTYHNVSDVAGVFHPCSSYFAKALNAKQATIEALKKEKCPKLHKYPKFILHHCMKLLPLLCQPFGFRSCSQQEQTSYKPCMTPQLHYFDYYDTEDGIIFVNCFKHLPDITGNFLLS